MSKNHPIISAIDRAFSFNKARKKIFSALILAVIKTRDVNLMQLAGLLPSKASHESQYRKLQRFFEKWDFCACELASFILSRIPKPEQGYKLNIDRTNWQYGKKHINVLTIGISLGKVSCPLIWKTLPKSTKRGNSKSEHRITLMNKLLKVLPAKDIHSITMDREFNGNDWLAWLDKRGIGFVLRLRRNTLVDGKSAGSYRSTRKAKTYSKNKVFERELYFGCKSIKKGRESKLYIVSNKFPPHEALELYRSRWGIEVFFGHLKKKGFNFENTRMAEKKKIDKLLAVLAFAFLITVGWGLIMREKTRLNAHQKRKSIFRLGLDQLQKIFAEPNDYKDSIDSFKRWVSGDVSPSNFVV